MCWTLAPLPLGLELTFVLTRAEVIVDGFASQVASELGLPSCATGKEPTCQCRRPKRHGFDSQIGKIPWRKAWQPTPIFLPEESPWTEEPDGL